MRPISAAAAVNVIAVLYRGPSSRLEMAAAERLSAFLFLIAPSFTFHFNLKSCKSSSTGRNAATKKNVYFSCSGFRRVADFRRSPFA